LGDNQPGASVVLPSELLARGIFSEKYARKAKRHRGPGDEHGSMPRRVFLERPGHRKISVDRIDLMTPKTAVALGKARADERPSARFFGWAVILVEDARKHDREVFCTPIANSNPYHADIVLPSDVVKNRDKQRSHAQELADASCWKCRPDSQ
jgi:hypothetical protein